MDNIISYAAFLKDRDNFRNSGTRTGSDFNLYDTPSHKFFKLLFYFWNSDLDDNLTHSGGLLAPTWEIYRDDGTDKYMNYDSAWAYLKNNDEYERAEKLEQFVTLLSNINSESPWYFNEITGLGEALDRKQNTGEFKIEDERKKITIKCLPDSFDNRIETLLSLYRDITWSWANKREIIPANLRKFDMGLYIWESPIYAMNSDSVLDEKSDKYSSSYKLIEFHNCEFDYNSLKSGYESLTNKEGFTNEFTIDIMFDDCYEHSYNSIMMRTIGDVITTDTAMIVYSDDAGAYKGASREQGKIGAKYNSDTYKSYNELSNRLEKSSNRPNNWYTDIFIDGSYFIQDGDGKINVGSRRTLDGYNGSNWDKKGFASNMIDQLVGKVTNDLKSVGNRLLLGNLYTYSISKMAGQLKSIFDGNVFTALNAVDEYAGTNIMNGMHKYSLGALAQEGQGRLNDMSLDRKTGRNQDSPQSIGQMYDDVPTEQYNSRTYMNTPFDRSEPSVQMGDIFPTVQKETVKTLGNLNKARTLINNI